MSRYSLVGGCRQFEVTPVNTYHITRRHIPKERSPHTHSRENPKPHIPVLSLILAIISVQIAENVCVLVTLWICFREMVDSNLGRDTGCTDVFLSACRQMPG
jgi:hypothetical protein